jgi:hypothetical protein
MSPSKKLLFMLSAPGAAQHSTPMAEPPPNTPLSFDWCVWPRDRRRLTYLYAKREWELLERESAEIRDKQLNHRERPSRATQATRTATA